VKKFNTVLAISLAAALMMTSQVAIGSEQHDEMKGHMDHGGGNHVAASHAEMAISATGKLNAINLEKRKVNITHGPIPALQWPPMRMDFMVKKGVALDGLGTGQQVQFSIVKSGEYDYVVTQISPVR